jgi:hypothetical protein|tara:strand:- start:126 stop:293 length:168 start_codon:yes stop_codon:yes gene_type:complete
MMNNGKSIGSTAGIVYGLYYSMKHQKNFTQTALFVVGFGFIGLMVGKAIEKFREE